MGQSGSSSAAVSEVPAAGRTVSRYVATFKKLYRELIGPDETGEPANDDLFRTRFQQHFGGPCLELGHLIYQQLFGYVTTAVSMEMFVAAATRLERVCTRGSSEEKESFVFSIFAEGAEQLNEKTLTDVVHSSLTLALVIGSELHDHQTTGVPRDHALISALLDSAWKMVETETKQEISQGQFHLWVSSHCPRLLDGLLHWITSSLLLINLEGEEQGAESHGAESTVSPSSHYYRLPTPHLTSEEERMGERGRELQVLIWSLSISLPLTYLGHRDDEDKTTKVLCDYPIGGSWTLLYSSSLHGFSMNRFQHHCSDYREPSVMILDCRAQQGGGGGGEVYRFAIAVDMEWKDGAFLWGGEKLRLLQLQPSFLLLSSGAKRISLNEKKRGFPTGLRVMSSSETNSNCLLEIDSALETACYRGVSMAIVRVEVWGCGGDKAAETQQRVKEWEKRLIMKRRKIKASTVRDEWVNSPDRYILEMGGVPVNRPTEQQQQ